MSGENYSLLLVDDDDIDTEALMRSFKKIGAECETFVARDGDTALDMLRGRVQPSVQRPCIVVLDINMPRMTGIEFLDEIRADHQLMDMIVFVLTTSSDRKDVFQAYDHNVAGYLVKSDVGDMFIEAAKLIDQYARTVLLPS